MTMAARLPFDGRKMAVIGALGVASGLPAPLLGDAIRTWARESGVDLSTIGALSLLTLPLGIKFLWSPWLDRPLGRLPRRRGWLILFQVLVALLIAAMAACDPGGSLGLLAMVMLALAFASASQDVVIDGYRADRLSYAEVGLGSAFATAGWRKGYMFSGALIFFIASRWGWPMAYLVMAAVQLSTVVVSLRAAEPDVPPPAAVGLRQTVVQPFRLFIRAHGVGVAALLLVFAAVFKASDALGNSMAAPFLTDHGYDRDMLGIRGALGMPLAILGGFIGGFALPWLGLTRGLVLGGLLQAASNLVYLPLLYAPPSVELIVLLAVVENLCAGLAVAAFMGFLLTCCMRQWSGTQYALLTAAMFLGSLLLASIAGYVVDALGYTLFFLYTAWAGLLGIVMIPLVIRRTNQFTETTPPL